MHRLESPAPGKIVRDKLSPLPGPFANVALFSSQMWRLRALLTEHWNLTLNIKWVLKIYWGNLKIADGIGFAVGVITIVMVKLCPGNWVFLDLQGISFCYTSLKSSSGGNSIIVVQLLFSLLIFDAIMVYFSWVSKPIGEISASRETTRLTFHSDIMMTVVIALEGLSLSLVTPNGRG